MNYCKGKMKVINSALCKKTAPTKNVLQVEGDCGAISQRKESKIKK